MCLDSTVLVSGSLHCHISAQAAVLVAPTEACKLAEDKSATNYTDSQYGLGLVHDFGTTQEISDGKPFLNHVLIANLLHAILPTHKSCVATWLREEILQRTHPLLFLADHPPTSFSEMQPTPP